MDALRLLSRSTGLRTHAVKPPAQHIPSEGQSHAREANKKRKRDSDQAADVEHDGFSEDQIRQVHKEHKIRVVDLLKYHASDSASSRKEKKEKSRIFPPPLTSFAQLQSRHGVSKMLSVNVAEQGYHEPTEVQLATIPLLLDNQQNKPDLLTVAPTGSGKTLAFLIPLIEKVKKQHRDGEEDGSRHVSAIILAPTKELVGQIVNEGRKLTLRTGVTVTAMRKGMRLSESMTQLDLSDSDDEEIHEQRGSSQGIVKSDILVSTPLSLVHALSGADSETVALPNIETITLDEADVLLDPIFRDQTLTVWQACTSPNLRISLWSATMGSNIEDHALSEILNRRKRLQITPQPPLLRVIIGLKDSSLPSINHKLIYAATEPGKLLGLRQLLHPSRSQPSTTKASTTTAPPPLRPPFLIFTQTITRATALYTELQYDIPAAAGGSSRLAVLHSSLSESARSAIMSRFRAGTIWVLITTDLLSRGVDFRGINGVVNYDIPTTVASYIHRAGRTGRAGREGGVCVTFYTREDVGYVKGIANVIAASQRGAEGQGVGLGLEKWVLDALPDLSKKDRKELKERGVGIRRAAKESDDADERRRKRKARIGTKSGYEKKLENNRRGAVMGSRRRKEGLGDDWDGFD